MNSTRTARASMLHKSASPRIPCGSQFTDTAGAALREAFLCQRASATSQRGFSLREEAEMRPRRASAGRTHTTFLCGMSSHYRSYRVRWKISMARSFRETEKRRGAGLEGEFGWCALRRCKRLASHAGSCETLELSGESPLCYGTGGGCRYVATATIITGLENRFVPMVTN